MKKFVCLCTWAFMSLASIGQTTLTLQPDASRGKDAEIFSCESCGYSTRNFGTIAENSAIAWTKDGAAHNIRSLIQFDLGSIPSSASIQSATLSLYSATGSDEGKHYGFFGSNKAYLYRITSSWDENTVTWNSRPATTTLNRVPIPGSTNSTQNYPGINVTHLVQDMVSDPENSFGFMIKLQSETEYKKLVFASSDHANAALRPKLTVVYRVHSPVADNSGSELQSLPMSRDIRIYPNPAKESVSFSINAVDNDDAFVSIYDVNGREMVDREFQLTQGNNQFSFQTAPWPRGLYMVIIKTGGEMITEKLLLE